MEQQLYLNNQKWCKECNQYLDILNFYHIYKNTHSTLCRTHSNELRMKTRLLKYPAKVTGFKKLPETVRTNILNDITNNKFSLMKISKKYDLKYPTLVNWNKTNQLV